MEECCNMCDMEEEYCDMCDMEEECNYNHDNEQLDCSICCIYNETDCYCRDNLGYCEKL